MPPIPLERRRDGAAALALALIGGYLLLAGERDADVVEPLEQAAADLVVDLEGDLAALEADLLGLEVDLARSGVRQGSAVLVAHHHGQQADLRAVGVEDVGEARSDESPEAVVLQPPRRMLARGAAAEVLARHEDRVGRQIPAGLLGPVVEQELTEPAALDPLEELLRHDLVGIHVAAVEVRDRACDLAYRVHHLAPFNPA